jgi:hypothetical protein
MWVEVGVCPQGKRFERSPPSLFERHPRHLHRPPACDASCGGRESRQSLFREGRLVCARPRKESCAHPPTQMRGEGGLGPRVVAKERDRAPGKLDRRRRRWPHWGEGALARPRSGAPLLRLSLPRKFDHQSGSLWFSPVEWFSVVLSCGVVLCGSLLWSGWFSVVLSCGVVLCASQGASLLFLRKRLGDHGRALSMNDPGTDGEWRVSI